MYRAAVIGLGNIGLLFDIPRKVMPQSHSLAYHLHKDIEFVAAAGVRLEQGDALVSIAPEAKFYTDLNTMLKEHELDLISICTPSEIRLELLRNVFQQSPVKLIFLEKPVATSLAEGEAIVALAQQYNRTVVVNLSRRWSEAAGLMRQAVQSGHYGKVNRIHLRYTRGIYNYGSHLFDLVRFIAGTIDTVQVLRRVPTRLDNREDWTYSFIFTAENGTIPGYAEAFDDRDYLIFEMDLFLEKGKIEMRQSGDEIRFYTTDTHPMLGGTNQLVLELTEQDLNSRSSMIMNAAEHLVEILRSGAKPICSLEDGMYPMYVAEAINRSYRNNRSNEKVVITP
ncbi:Gfo/Idh/MocA family protein [Paenibacillus cremeus]|uniref:Gfo/Idh/MocA family oxidoreductase n=1 Tax=Paenibacillus cremeus TaxID=2163881 RepID=A0A559K7D1_9BACL|nr:Gfo/Idh/MocA family oxidoreductase [Paenibacillus cremeus]TVY08042.1 Gfo/Idh/MocA family oxidoreductase [Paenibacillus cremeus]